MVLPHAAALGPVCPPTSSHSHSGGARPGSFGVGRCLSRRGDKDWWSRGADWLKSQYGVSISDSLRGMACEHRLWVMRAAECGRQRC